MITIKISKKTAIIAMFSFFYINTITSYAKLPVDYDNFVINGKKEKLAIADILIDNIPLDKKNSNINPVTINSRTFVPVRALSEKLGYNVTYIEALQKVTLDKNGKKIELFIGKNTAKVNNKDVKIQDKISPMIIDSSLYVPIRFVVENMGLEINYDAKKNQISLQSNQQTLDDSHISDILFDTANKSVATNNVEDNVINNSVLDVAISNSNQTGKDPSVPTDVENFIVAKPTEPVKPVVESVKVPVVEPVKEVVKKEESQKETPVINTSAPKYTITSKFDSEKEIFTITQNQDNIDANYFFLSSPKKLVVDIKNADLGMFETNSQNIGGNIFTYADVLYHKEGNYTRYAIVLSDKSDKEDVDVKIVGNQVIMKKKDAIQTTPAISQIKDIVYKFDRKTGSISIKTNKNIDIQNTSNSNDVIYLSIPKSSINLTDGTTKLNNRLVKEIVIQSDTNNYSVKIQLSKNVSYNIEKLSDNITRINLNRYASNPPVIVLDAGHGGKDPGAQRSDFLTNEKTLNIQVVKKLQQKLIDAGYDVYLTRQDDTFITLNDIASYSNSYDPDIFISIHHNSASNKSVNGIESFYNASEDSKKLATIIQKNMISKSKANNRGVKDMPFVVIKKTTSPATLLELGFMTNDNELKKNMSDEYQNLLAESILNGINEYFGR